MQRVLRLAAMQCAALGALTAPAIVAVSVLVGRLVGHADAPRTLALVDGAAAVAAVIAAPLFGRLADRGIGRLGRRRPWLIAGALLGIVGSAAMAHAPGIGALTLAWMGTQAAYNMVFGAVNGLVAEGLAAEDRTRASGALSAVSFVGTLPGLAAAALFADQVETTLLVVPILAALVIIPLAFSVPDPPPPDASVAADGASSAASDETPRPEGARRTEQLRSGAWRSALDRRLAIVVLSRFALSALLSASMAFALYLFIARWGLDEASAIRATSLSTMLGSVGIVIASAGLALVRRPLLSARMLLLVSFCALATAMAARGLATAPVWFQIATALTGLAMGLGFTAVRSLAYEVVPAQNAGFGLGLVSAAGSAAGIVAPLGASYLLDLGRWLPFGDAYAGMYILLAVAALLLVPVTHRLGRSGKDIDRAVPASAPAAAEDVPPRLPADRD